MAESEKVIARSSDDFKHSDFPDGTIFVVDVSPEMFEQCPDGRNKGDTYLRNCISVNIFAAHHISFENIIFAYNI